MERMIRKLVVSAVVISMLVAVEGKGAHMAGALDHMAGTGPWAVAPVAGAGAVAPVAGAGAGGVLPDLDKCLGECYPKCKVSQHLWCATLCIGKCKQSKSIPDNLCNCTYSCSRFKCADVGTDKGKVQDCVKSCSRLCNITM
ncbi:hypothetical protein CFOL_v3_16159 [Cephalotus follicularis]|uniref:Uncharacterized protein n=1 Tax=Cephalotus follicularis TaxID=3775 RepID=A0A1Q3BXM4_CEPFO|nr:hypothetical protein CFOL_v3_16159 [Cephalotus follicularis]